MRRHLAGLIVVGLVAVGCTGNEGSSADTGAPNTDPITQPDEPPDITESTGTDPTTTVVSTNDTSDTVAPPTESVPTLDWMPCDDLIGLECASLAVPLDHTEPDGVAVDLALARLPAGDPDTRIGSLVFNPGGPGGSGLSFLQFAQFAIPADVAARFDLVSFDPRGVGASSSVDCDLTLDDGVMLIADDDRAAWDDLLATMQSELDTCMAEPTGLEQRIGTNNAARDLDLIRAALGDEQLSYVGFSYGTRLGATYAELFPDRVRALVLDGGVKPTTDLAALAAEQGAGFDQAFDNFAAACDADLDCLLQELGPTIDVVAAVRSEIVELGPFGTDDPERMLTAGELDLGIIAALYSKDAWPFLAQAIYLADIEADGSLFQALADSQIGREVDGTYTNQTESNSFINCADDDARPDVDETFAAIDEVADASRYFGDLLRGSTGCLGVPDALDPLVLGPAATAAPILVIGTTGDPATPYEWSVEMAEALDSGVLYTVEGEGHTAYTSIECVAPIVGAYLIDLDVPAEGSSCADDADTDFFVPSGESEVDQFIALIDCLIAEGAPLEPVTVADVLADPAGEELLGDVDPTDPALGAAVLACSELIPG